MEAERERLVHLKELETQKQQAEELRYLARRDFFGRRGVQIDRRALLGPLFVWSVGNWNGFGCFTRSHTKHKKEENTQR